MFDPKIIHVSLDEAREELAKRWQNVELRKKIEVELGESFWPEFKDKPRGMLGRQLPSPDNGFTFFVQMSHYINAVPLAIEYLDDKFVSANEEKKGLGRLRLLDRNNEKKIVDIIDFYESEKNKISDVVTKTKEKLIDFHHNLLNISGYDVEISEKTEWFKKNGKPKEFYYNYLLHFVTHGVLFETIQPEGDVENESASEYNFINDAILSNIDKIKQKFGLAPLIIRIYPADQIDEEDFYWWCYPPHVNEYLVNYAETNKLKFKKY